MDQSWYLSTKIPGLAYKNVSLLVVVCMQLHRSLVNEKKFSEHIVILYLLVVGVFMTT